MSSTAAAGTDARQSRDDVKACLTAAAIVAGSGFGALSLIWLAGDWPRRPGLYDYWTTTLGDGVLLPTFASLLVLAHRRLPATPGEDSAVLIGAIIGACAAALLQLTWLASADKPLNWTFKAAHRFNVAGDYHAVFMVAAAAFFGGMVALAGRRIWVLRRGDFPAAVEVARSRALALAGAVTLSFLMLAVVDDARAHSLTGATLLAAAGASVGWVVALAVVLGGALRHALRGVLVAMIAAVAVAGVAVVVGAL